MATIVNVSATARAPKDVVWAILADFPNIADYTDTVKASRSTSEAETGVGATRHCDLAPMGTVNERILEYVPGERLVISLYDTAGLPIKGSQTTFALEAVDAETTRISMRARPVSRAQ